MKGINNNNQKKHNYYELPQIELKENRRSKSRSTTKHKNNIKEITTKEWKKNECNNKELKGRSRRKQRLKPRSKN